MAIVVAVLAVVSVVAACGASPFGGDGADRPAPPPLPGPPVPAAAQAGHPNIVFVLTDDLSSDLVRYMPHVQQMQAQGANFTDYNLADTLCCPSRASIFTGQFPHSTGVFTNKGPDGGYDVFHSRGDDQATFGTTLQQAGYHTAMMGKYLNGYEPTSDPVPPGWNEWDVAGNGYPEYDYDLNQNGHSRHYGSAPQDYLTDVVSGRGQDFIRSQAAARQPFALEIATFAPHGPATPAPQDTNAFPGLQAPRDPSFNQPDAPTAPAWLRDRQPLRPPQIAQLDQDQRKRAQSVQSVDRMIGNLQGELAATGQLANTVFVFSSDNGFHLGQHQLAAGKQTSFATDLTVPLVMTGPGIPAGRSIPQITQNVDLAPTFTAVAGAPPMPQADGRSLLPLVRGQSPPPDWRTAALVEHHGPNRAPDDPDRPRGKSAANPPTYTAIHTAEGTYTEYVTGEREWHDAATDPYQRNNTVALLGPDRLAALHATLTALAGCHGTPACTTAGQAPPSP